MIFEMLPPPAGTAVVAGGPMPLQSSSSFPGISPEELADTKPGTVPVISGRRTLPASWVQ